MRILITLMVVSAIAACKQAPELPSLISPYRIDIQQGNVITQEMVGKLKAGQTRSQVRFVLGSPLVTDMFHSDRWDYIYLLQRQGKPSERRRLTVIFDGDKLLRLEGDIVLTDQVQEPDALVPQLPGTKPAAAKPVAAAPTKPEAAKSAQKPPVAAAPAKSEPAKSDTAKAEAAKEDPAKADTAAADEKKEPPKRGMFGRMLDKIGF